ncbi:hypothetical protein ACFLJZ_000188 [Vibrio alginolyticus]
MKNTLLNPAPTPGMITHQSKSSLMMVMFQLMCLVTEKQALNPS